MPLLSGKKILVTGLLSNRSISYGIAKAAHREGAELAFTYQNERFKERVTDMAAEFGSKIAVACDVGNDAEIDALFQEMKSTWGRLDGLVHAIAFAPRESIAGDFLEGSTREAFRIAHDVSSYSFAALAKGALPLLSKNASLLTLTYLGAVRVVPNYNTMGLAKASLEASVRYLAASLGPRGMRVNGISAGPIKTLAAAGIGGFGKILKFVEQHAPLRRNVTTEDVGNAAVFLLSDLAAAVTGEILYVDGGFSHVMAGSLSTSSPDSPDLPRRRRARAGCRRRLRTAIGRIARRYAPRSADRLPSPRLR
jgi:enoyl-[acyl-carrier protein] reductase I